MNDTTNITLMPEANRPGTIPHFDGPSALARIAVPTPEHGQPRELTAIGATVISDGATGTILRKVMNALDQDTEETRLLLGYLAYGLWLVGWQAFLALHARVRRDLSSPTKYVLNGPQTMIIRRGRTDVHNLWHGLYQPSAVGEEYSGIDEARLITRQAVDRPDDLTAGQAALVGMLLVLLPPASWIRPGGYYHTVAVAKGTPERLRIPTKRPCDQLPAHVFVPRLTAEEAGVPELIEYSISAPDERIPAGVLPIRLWEVGMQAAIQDIMDATDADHHTAAAIWREQHPTVVVRRAPKAFRDGFEAHNHKAAAAARQQWVDTCLAPNWPQDAVPVLKEAAHDAST